ncbi:hypothetical protein GCM10009103_54650 [Pseudomonas koreensis]|nr:hypothetical protein GCM10009103_54650 [Pseudomonas koreensis]
MWLGESQRHQASSKSDFFNRIGRFLPFKATQCAGQIRCKRLVKSNANGWSSPCNYAAKVTYIELRKLGAAESRAITHIPDTRPTFWR